MKRKLTLGLMLSAVLFLSSCMNGVDNEKKGFISISIDDLSRSSYKALPVYDLDDSNHEYTFELTGKAEGEETTETFSGINYANGKFSFAQTPSVSLGNWDFTFKIFRKENSGETPVDKLFLIGTTSVEIEEGINPLNFAMNKATVEDAGQNGLPNGSLNIKVKFPSDGGTTSVDVAIKSSTDPDFSTEPVTFNQDNFTSSDEEGYYSFEYTMDNIPAGAYYLNLNFFNEDILLCAYPILVQIESGAVSYINGNKEDVLLIPSLEKIYYLTFKYESDNGPDEIKVAYNSHSCVNLENLNDNIISLKNGYEIESWTGLDSDNNEVSFPSDGKWNSSFSEERNVTFTANLKPIEYNITYNMFSLYTDENNNVISEDIEGINLPQDFPTTYNIESTFPFEKDIQLDGYIYISNYLVEGESFSEIELGSTGDLEIRVQVEFCDVYAEVYDSSGYDVVPNYGESYYDLTQNAEYTLVYRVKPHHKDFDNPTLYSSREDVTLTIGDLSTNEDDGSSERRVTFSAPPQLGEDQDFSVILKIDDFARGLFPTDFKVKGTGIITLTSDYLETNEYILNEGEYKVTEDISLTQQIVVNGDVTIFADGERSITSNSGVFDASSATELTLGTGNNNHNLKIKNISTIPAIQTSSDNTTTIVINDGVSFEDCAQSYCISFLSPNSSLNVNGGSFKNNNYGAILLSNSSATVNITGGEISNNACPAGNYAIQVESGSLNITGGSVCNNTVNGVASGAAINNKDGSVDISGYDSAELSFPFEKNIIDGEVQEDSTSGSEGTDLGIVYSGSATRGGNNYLSFTISSSNGLKIFRDIVNGTLSEALTIPSDDPAVGDYTIDYTTPNPYIDGKLANNIELSFEEGESWTPIGINDEAYFSGSFDGCGFEISGMQISTSKVENQGLFGSIITFDSDTISDLTVSGTMLVSNEYTGGIAGNATGYNFKKCVNKVVINSSSTELGGIVGYANSCTIEGCVNEGSVTSTFDNTAYNACVGGIVGYITDTEVTKCYNSASITVESSNSVGGIIGYETSSTSYLYNDYNVNTGTITGKSLVAGIIGYASTGRPSFAYCANYGTIKATGGAVGLISNSSSSNKITISGCLSAGSEEVTNICYVVDANATITYSIYDSTILVVDDVNIKGSSGGGVQGCIKQDLISGEVPAFFESGGAEEGYSFAQGRYPIPNIEDALPDGYWAKIVESVTRQ